MALTPMPPLKLTDLSTLADATSRSADQIADVRTGAVTREWRTWRQRLKAVVSQIQTALTSVQATLNELILETVAPWVDVAYSAANFGANTAGLWTVDLGDQLLYRYCLIGNSMTLQVTLRTTTVGNVTTTELRVAVPPGFRASNNPARQGGTVWNTSAVAGIGGAFILTGGQYISLQRVDAGGIGTAYPNVVDDLAVGFTMQFEVNRL